MLTPNARFSTAARARIASAKRWRRRQAPQIAVRFLPSRLWRWYAMAEATVTTPLFGQYRPIAGPALRVLGRPDTRWNRLRFEWSNIYRLELDEILVLGLSQLDAAWRRRRVRVIGHPPAGGAILLGVHHFGMYLRTLRTSDAIAPLGLLYALQPNEPEQALMRAAYGDHLFQVAPPGVFALRRCEQFLAQGGYLITNGDIGYAWKGSSTAPNPILGKEIGVPSGTVWLARRTGRPIVPFLFEFRGGAWQLRFCDPIEPSAAAVAAAIESLIRSDPEQWSLWPQWHAAPAAVAAAEPDCCPP